MWARQNSNYVWKKEKISLTVHQYKDDAVSDLKLKLNMSGQQCILQVSISFTMNYVLSTIKKNCRLRTLTQEKRDTAVEKFSGHCKLEKLESFPPYPGRPYC